MRPIRDPVYIQSFVRVLQLPCRKPRTKPGGTCSADKSTSEFQIWRDTHLSHRNDNCSNHPAHSPDICSTALKITSPDRQSSPPSCHVISFMTAASCSSVLPLPWPLPIPRRTAKEQSRHWLNWAGIALQAATGDGDEMTRR